MAEETIKLPPYVDFRDPAQVKADSTLIFKCTCGFSRPHIAGDDRSHIKCADCGGVAVRQSAK